MNYHKKDIIDLDYNLWKKFKTFFEEKGYNNYKSFGIIDKKYSGIYNPKAGLSEIGSIIASKAIKEEIKWINLSPVFRYKNLPLVAVAKNDMALFDTITFVSAVPARGIFLEENIKTEDSGNSGILKNIARELNFFYENFIKTKDQRREVYQAFLDLSKDEKIPVGHDFILTKEFVEKYTNNYWIEYKKTNLEKWLFKYIASLGMIRMTQKFNERFEIYKELFSFLEMLDISKENLFFSIHGGGHPVSDFFIPEEMLLKKVLVNSFDINEKSIFKFANENTLEIFLEKEYPQIGPRSQVFYKIPGTSEMIELGVATFSEYFLDSEDRTIKYSENFVSRFSFGLQRLNMIWRIDKGHKVEIKDISLFAKVVEEVKKAISEKREYYSDLPFLAEKRDILKISQYLMSVIVLLIEKVDLDQNKESEKYIQFNIVFDELAELFFNLHLIKKEKVFDFIYDIIEIVLDHYQKLYGDMYLVSEKQKEKIVKIISEKIFATSGKKILAYKSLVNQDWE